MIPFGGGVLTLLLLFIEPQLSTAALPEGGTIMDVSVKV